MPPQSPSPQHSEQNSTLSVKQWQQDWSQVLFKTMWALAFTVFQAVKAWVGFLHWRRPMPKRGSEWCTVQQSTHIILITHTRRIQKGPFPITLAWPSVTQCQENTSGWQGRPQAHSGRPSIAYGKRVPAGLVWKHRFQRDAPITSQLSRMEKHSTA